MIEWFGPIIYEYYSATEVYLLTAIDSEDWLAHRGSVGKALLGTPHILDDDGNELPVGEPGTVWSEGGAEFEYHNDPEKTAGARNDRGWTTVGDIGYLDADGYLYLTDRKADMIISGGVNVYPQEAENVLIGHPAVDDVAVFGIPNPDLGEEVKAVVQLRAGRPAARRARGRADRVLPGAAREVQVPALDRLHRRAAAPPDREALQAAPARPVRRGLMARRAPSGSAPGLAGRGPRARGPARGRAVVPAAAAAVLGDAVGQRVSARARRRRLPRRLRHEPRAGLGRARARRSSWRARGPRTSARSSARTCTPTTPGSRRR